MGPWRLVVLWQPPSPFPFLPFAPFSFSCLYFLEDFLPACSPSSSMPPQTYMVGELFPGWHHMPPDWWLVYSICMEAERRGLPIRRQEEHT